MAANPFWMMILLWVMGAAFLVPAVLAGVAVWQITRKRRFQYTLIALWLFVVAMSGALTAAMATWREYGCLFWPMPLWIIALTLQANARGEGPVCGRDVLFGALVGSVGYGLAAVSLRALEVIAGR
jgi:hypothetical protein